MPGGRRYSGQFAPLYARVPDAAFVVRAYGHGPEDPRRVRVDTLGVETCDVAGCDMSTMEDGGLVEVPLDKVAIPNRVLRRGRLAQAAKNLANGVRNDVENPITVMPRTDSPGGFVVVAGRGEHRIAHLKLSGRKGNVPVRMMKPGLGKSGTSEGAEKAWLARHHTPEWAASEDKIMKATQAGRTHKAGGLLDQAVHSDDDTGFAEARHAAFRLVGLAEAEALNAGNFAHEVKEVDKAVSDKWYEAKSRWSGLAEAVKKKDWKAAEDRLEEVSKVVLG